MGLSHGGGPSLKRTAVGGKRWKSKGLQTAVAARSPWARRARHSVAWLLDSECYLVLLKLIGDGLSICSSEMSGYL